MNNSTKLIITCPKHGDFEQVPISHLKGFGCNSCSESKGEKIISMYLTNYNIDFIRQKYNLLIGETTAEKLKIDASNSASEKDLFEIRGRELVTGLPKSMKVHGHDIDEAITRDIDTIIETVKLALEGIEPEVSADIYETGIFLSGGGAAIKELTRKLEKEFNLTVTIADEPI